MALFPNPFAGQQAQGMQPSMPELPRVPWRSNPLVTSTALGLLGGRNINEGFANAAAAAPAGMAAKSSLQGFMLKRQEEEAAKAAQRAAWNAGMKWKSGVTLSAEDQAALAGAPEIALKFMPETASAQWESLTDPQQRLAAGIPADDLRPAQRDRMTGEIKFPGGGGTSVNVNTGEKLTEGQSKDVNFYARGISANAELTPDLEQALTDLPASLWSNAPVLGNYAVSPKFQMAKRAASEFLAVVLRKDTGAAVTAQEFDLYGPMYLPVPGDGPEVLESKRKARVKVIQSIKLGLGTARPMADQIDAELGGATPEPTQQQAPGEAVDWQTYFGGQ